MLDVFGYFNGFPILRLLSLYDQSI